AARAGASLRPGRGAPPDPGRGGPHLQRHARAHPPDREPEPEKAAESGRSAETARSRLGSSILDTCRLTVGMAFDLQQALRAVVEQGGAGLAIKVPSRPLIRLQGRLPPLADPEPLTPAD